MWNAPLPFYAAAVVPAAIKKFLIRETFYPVYKLIRDRYGGVSPEQH